MAAVPLELYLKELKIPTGMVTEAMDIIRPMRVGLTVDPQLLSKIPSCDGGDRRCG